MAPHALSREQTHRGERFRQGHGQPQSVVAHQGWQQQEDGHEVDAAAQEHEEGGPGPTFSRHGRAQASLALLICLIEKVLQGFRGLDMLLHFV